MIEFENKDFVEDKSFMSKVRRKKLNEKNRNKEIEACQKVLSRSKIETKITDIGVGICWHSPSKDIFKPFLKV
jgi:hypothetical protein